MDVGRRLGVVAIAFAALLLASYDLASPYRVGMMGDDIVAGPNGAARIVAVYRGSATARAGLRVGDVFLIKKLPLALRLEFYGRRANQRVTYFFERDGVLRRATLLPTPYYSLRPIEDGPLAYIILLAFAVTAMLIALRGHGARETRLLAFLLAFYALERAADWFISTAPTAPLALAGALLDLVAWSFVTYCELLFIAVFPPITSPLRNAIRRYALPLTVAVALTTLYVALQQTTFAVAGLLNGTLAWGPPAELAQAVLYALLIAGAIDAIAHADVAHRVQTRWAASAIIISTIPLLLRALYYGLTGDVNPTKLDPWVTLFADVPLLALAYAVLRHRLVDLGVLMSRAAIFTTVSALVVALFVIIEWAGGNVLAGALGESARHGAAGEAFSAALALVLGLSARSIHGFTERYLNRIFFAGRAEALSHLRRFAQETDVITDVSDLFRLTYEAVNANTESAYTAVYVLDNASYRARFAPETLPSVFGINDAAVVRLRRWNEPYEVERGSHALSEALLLPMTIRGTLLGFLCCGPKRERTRYLRDEIEVLASLAHRVGAAYEFIARESVAPAFAPVRA